MVYPVYTLTRSEREGGALGHFNVADLVLLKAVVEAAGKSGARYLLARLYWVRCGKPSNVFYDDFYSEMLWGKNLVVFFDDIYRKGSRFCVMFISNEYAQPGPRPWITR